jgi:hypothetical protein
LRIEPVQKRSISIRLNSACGSMLLAAPLNLPHFTHCIETGLPFARDGVRTVSHIALGLR